MELCQYMRYVLSCLLMISVGIATAQPYSTTVVPGKVGTRTLLSNGWYVSPYGESVALNGDLPLNMAIHPSKNYAAVFNTGQSTQSIQILDITKKTVIASQNVAKGWYGLKFSADGQYLYASGGNDDRVMIYSFHDLSLAPYDSIKLDSSRHRISPTGLDVNSAANVLYVVTKDDSSLYTVDLKGKKVMSKLSLGAEAFTCLLSNDKKTLYISLWGGDKVIAYDVNEKKIVKEITVGDNPNEIILSNDNKTMYVANANDNSVSVIDVQKWKVTETLNASLYPDAPSGSTTNGLALTKDQKTLLIANADNNCLAVFDVSKKGNSVSKGFIPVGWYPTCVRTAGDEILVANGKGMMSLANPHGPNPTKKREKVVYQGGKDKPVDVQYIGGMLKGTVSFFKMPNEKTMGKLSEMVYQNCPYTKEKEQMTIGEEGNPIPAKVGGTSPIKYVFYVIKENRTYDQVLSDCPGGNGDTSLLLFGRNVTPNLHKMCDQYVLLDNFYCDGEVSADGHNWSMGAYATDYLEKTWPTSYGGRGGGYDAEGNRKVANNKMFLFDLCAANNVSYRSYGEFINDNKPNIPSLKDHFCTNFTGWDMETRDTTRAHQWMNDMDSLMKAGSLPSFNVLRFGNDHTEGLRKGHPTPMAHVADNDMSIGMILDHLSHSPVWQQSAVFIVEDDAQNGPDHVDAHRTTAYVAGGYVKHGYADHTMYSTSSMIRTMELILGLPPMTQYDAAATPMWNSFGKTPTSGDVFTMMKENIPLNEMNKDDKLGMSSERMDFSKEDLVPDEELNKVIWASVKGNLPYPAARKSAFLKVTSAGDED